MQGIGGTSGSRSSFHWSTRLRIYSTTSWAYCNFFRIVHSLLYVPEIFMVVGHIDSIRSLLQLMQAGPLGKHITEATIILSINSLAGPHHLYKIGPPRSLSSQERRRTSVREGSLALASIYHGTCIITPLPVRNHVRRSPRAPNISQ